MMAYIDDQLYLFRNMIEDSIVEGGAKGKESIIRSSALINLIHDAVKKELINAGVNPKHIFPKWGERKPEMKLAGFLKQKDQDVCVVPSNIAPVSIPITWGPMAFEGKTDPYGFEFTTNMLVINVRSQMSSLAKNSDTLFERTFAEALNLRLRYPEIVLGEVYLIPVQEYKDSSAKYFSVEFKDRLTNLEKYISFFNAINNRKTGGEAYKYERCALLIVDFDQPQPYLFSNSYELKQAGYLSQNFGIEYADLNFQNFARDILTEYSRRYNINNLR